MNFYFTTNINSSKLLSKQFRGEKPINSEKKIRLFGENIKRIKLLYILLTIASLLKVSLNTPKTMYYFIYKVCNYVIMNQWN